MSYNVNYYEGIIGVNVFMQKRLTRIFVGLLERKEGKYCFTYDKGYMAYKHSFCLGPDLPMTQVYFESDTIFPTFEDRIPSRENPAYPEYCSLFGIDPDEKDFLILLSTIGRKIPGCFMCEPKWAEQFSAEDLKEFRKKLGLSTRDFAACFGLSQSNIVRIENRKASGTETLKILDIFHRFPDVSAYYIRKHGGEVHSHTKERILSILEHKQDG